MSNNKVKAIDAIKHYFSFTDKILREIDLSKDVYVIQDTNDFAKLEDNIADVQRVYWEEILQRAHWAGLTSLIRNFQWLKGTATALNENNLLSFTANLRCLIESGGDNIYSLLNVSEALADNYADISKGLSGVFENNTMFVCEELEDVLIHHSYARKVSKKEKQILGEILVHNAKTATEYLKKMDSGIDNGPIAQLYSVLCQFTHPAASSVHYLLDTKIEAKKYQFSYLNDADKKV